MSFDPNAIGNRIFTLRTNAKLSQEKLAEKLGVSHRHLGNLERGSSNGSVKILIDIAEYFHVLPVLHRQERFLCYSKISARVSSCTSPRSCA